MRRPVRDDELRKATHDFNNLLTAIIGAADAILQRSAVDHETRADIAHIREGARRGTMLVRRLRGDAQAAPEAASPVAVNETIHATWRLLNHSLGPDIDLTLDLQALNDRVMVDAAQLDRALLNLIANARHAMPNGGTVILGTNRRVVAETQESFPDIIPPGDYIVITVADTGHGIPESLLARIFAPGVTSRRRTGGSGLGLPSTLQIVHQSGGFLSIATVPGRGSRFEIYLPRAERPCAIVAIAAARTVVLVEDDLLVRGVTERALRRAGWQVLCVGTAEDALEILNSTRCDLMIADIALPGMDGLSLARTVLAQHPELPVILTSGYQRTTDVGATVTFLTKPYAQEDLLATIERAVVGR